MSINYLGPEHAKDCSGNGYLGFGVGIMKVYTYSEARQRLSEVLNLARTEEVVIRRRGGESFFISFKKSQKSPFDVPGIDTRATTKDILDAIKESRSRH
jgi:hypothetical protein